MARRFSRQLDLRARRVVRELPESVLPLAFRERSRRGLRPAQPGDTAADRAVARTADNAFFVRDAGRRSIVHVEIERGWRANLPHRMFEYAAGLYLNSGRRPVRSVVLLTRGGGGPALSRECLRVRAPGESVITFRYRVVRLRALAARGARRRWPPEVWVWTPAMRGATEGGSGRRRGRFGAIRGCRPAGAIAAWRCSGF